MGWESWTGKRRRRLRSVIVNDSVSKGCEDRVRVIMANNPAHWIPGLQLQNPSRGGVESGRDRIGIVV